MRNKTRWSGDILRRSKPRRQVHVYFESTSHTKKKTQGISTLNPSYTGLICLYFHCASKSKHMASLDAIHEMCRLALSMLLQHIVQETGARGHKAQVGFLCVNVSIHSVFSVSKQRTYAGIKHPRLVLGMELGACFHGQPRPLCNKRFLENVPT